MAISCIPSDLARESSCFCFSSKQHDQIRLYLLCQWANASGCVLPSKATTPDPANGSSASEPTSTVLSWANGGGATSYDVWFNGAFQGNQVGTTFDPGLLDGDTVYEWRIDAVNDCDTTTGDTWSFTTTALFSFSPSTAAVTWTDSGGVHTGNLAAFYATVAVTGIGTVTIFDCNSLGITSVTNIPSLSGVIDFGCQNNSITTLDFTGCSNLDNVDCLLNPGLTTLNVTGCAALTMLNCTQCNLSSLDVSAHLALNELRCGSMTLQSLTSLDVTGLTALTVLECDSNGLTTAGLVGLTTCTALITLDCSSNNAAGFTSLTLTGLSALTSLDCSICGNITTITLTGCAALANINALSCSSLDPFDVTPCAAALTTLNCRNCGILTTLNVTGCTLLNNLNIRDTSFDAAGIDTVECMLDANGTINGQLDITNTPGCAVCVCEGNLSPGKGWTITGP